MHRSPFIISDQDLLPAVKHKIFLACCMETSKMDETREQRAVYLYGDVNCLQADISLRSWHKFLSSQTFLCYLFILVSYHVKN